MTSANLDLVRSLYAAWERGDFSSAVWAHPEIEWIIAEGPTARTWTGVAGMAESFRGMLGAWEDLHVVVDEYRELDSERVLVLLHMTGRGQTSGLDLREIGSKGAFLLHVGGGRVTRSVFYYDRARAFADLGLAPEGDAAGPSL